MDKKEIILKEFLDKPVRYLKGVGPKRAEQLARLDIKSVADLISHYPRDYQDRTKIRSICEIEPNETVTILGIIQGINEIRPFRSKHNIRHILKIAIGDNSGLIYAVWFNQPYRKKEFQIGRKILFTGRSRFNAGRWELDPIEFEFIDNDKNHINGGILPIYPLTEGIEQRFLRGLIHRILEELPSGLPEPLPTDIIEKYKFLEINKAIREIHFPTDLNQINQIHNRFIYEELFLYQLILALLKQKRGRNQKPQKYQLDNELTKRFIDKLPFKLTSSQYRVYKEIKNDLNSNAPMNRLLQGDVGSGKTIVALLSILEIISSGYQSVFMVPTEVLAEQHYRTIKSLLYPLDIKVGLLTGSLSRGEKKELLKEIQTGNCPIIIGTHALIEKPVEIPKLGLVIIDEQHRFGVAQRNKLRKKGHQPDVLVMTATPIPRTLSMTIYGDLDISIIDEIPAGRPKIITRWYWENGREIIYSILLKEINIGHQGYIIYPLVDESDKLELKSAVQMFEHLQNDIFPSIRLGLIHGRMNKSEQENIMNNFNKGDIQLLVSTTVIEVGIDVANATVMVIEHADRFGLSQLHQLRGRIGRGQSQSYCILITDKNISKQVHDRLNILTQTMDGFVIAEQDMKNRGSGELLGTQQHGFYPFKLADLIRDREWLIASRRDAFELVSNDPKLLSLSHRVLRDILINRLGKKIEYAHIA